MRDGFERTRPPKIGGTLPHDHYIEAVHSIAISLKRIADALDSSDSGGRSQGSVLYWLEVIASAANAGRS